MNEANDDKHPVLREIGNSVRTRRLAARLTVKDFAEEAELSPRFVNQLEAGEGNISIARLARVAEVLGCSLGELMPATSSDNRLKKEILGILDRFGDKDWLDLHEWLTNRGGKAEKRRIALIGLRGAGKTTVGLLLARRLGTKFVELDSLIERSAGLSLEAIFTLHGEEYYRRLERGALVRLFMERSDCVVAPGGSIATDPESWETLKRHCFTVWLQAEPEEHMSRLVRQGDTRPMKGKPEALVELKSLLARRSPFYSRADLSVETTGSTPDSIVERILNAWSAATGNQ